MESHLSGGSCSSGGSCQPPPKFIHQPAAAGVLFSQQGHSCCTCGHKLTGSRASISNEDEQHLILSGSGPHKERLTASRLHLNFKCFFMTSSSSESDQCHCLSPPRAAARPDSPGLRRKTPHFTLSLSVKDIKPDDNQLN